MPDFNRRTIFFPFSRKGTRISAWPLKKQDRHVTISAIILSGCPLWQNRVTWKKLKNISPLQPAKSLTVTSISVKIRLLTVFSGIIPPLQKEKIFLFMHWFPCLLTLSIDEINLCLVFSNLLENAIQASVKTAPARRKINVEVYARHNHLLLIHVENTFDGKIQQKNNIFQSSKRSGNGIGIESVRHITDKNGGACDFTYKDGIFSAKIMLRI